MAQLIDKDAIVADIEKCYNECLKRAKITDSDYWNAKADAYRNVLAILNDTLEVKEVDLDTDFGVCWGEYCDCGGNINDYKVAKHFFELGISVSNKARKGEKV